MKQIHKTNFRIEVSTSDRWYNGYDNKKYTDLMRRDLEQMVEQIKRHVDDVNHITIAFDTQTFCSHCQLSWEEEKNGCPLCCGKAQEEWIVEQGFVYGEVYKIKNPKQMDTLATSVKFEEFDGEYIYGEIYHYPNEKPGQGRDAVLLANVMKHEVGQV